MPNHATPRIKAKDLDLKTTTVIVKRVTKVVEAGRTLSFTALVVVGDGKGVVGYGLGKAKEVAKAVQKGEEHARKNLVYVHIHRGTLPHRVEAKHKGAVALIIPASQGTGIIAGGAMRVVFQMAGFKDVLAKSKGSSNPQNVVQATMNALQSVRTPGQIANQRGISLDKLFNG